MTPHRRISSSSSSNSAPSEPTIDYFSFSPRSHPNQSYSLTLTVQGHEVIRPSLVQPPTSNRQRINPLLNLQKCSHAVATGNLIPIPNVTQILPLQTLSLIFTLRPIPINPLSFLINSLADTRTWGDTQCTVVKLMKGQSRMVALLALLPSRPGRQTDSTSFIPRAMNVQLLQIASQNLFSHPTQDQGPTQSKKGRDQEINSPFPFQARSHPAPVPTRSHILVHQGCLSTFPFTPDRDCTPLLDELCDSLGSQRDLCHEVQMPVIIKEPIQNSNKKAQRATTEHHPETEKSQMDDTPSPTSLLLHTSKLPKGKRVPTRRS